MQASIEFLINFISIYYENILNLKKIIRLKICGTSGWFHEKKHDKQ